jgi:hypothetical protein
VSHTAAGRAALANLALLVQPASTVRLDMLASHRMAAASYTAAVPPASAGPALQIVLAHGAVVVRPVEELRTAADLVVLDG